MSSTLLEMPMPDRVERAARLLGPPLIVFGCAHAVTGIGLFVSGKAFAAETLQNVMRLVPTGSRWSARGDVYSLGC